MRINVRNAIIAALIIIAIAYMATRPVHRGIIIDIKGKQLPIPTRTLAR